MVLDRLENPDPTGYEYIFNSKPIIYVNIPAIYYEDKPLTKIEPFYLKKRKNKRDNFKLR